MCLAAPGRIVRPTSVRGHCVNAIEYLVQRIHQPVQLVQRHIQADTKSTPTKHDPPVRTNVNASDVLRGHAAAAAGRVAAGRDAAAANCQSGGGERTGLCRVRRVQ